jgi:alpha-L-fucosidase
MKSLQKSALIAGIFGLGASLVQAAPTFAPSPGWALDKAPAVPPPVAPNSKNPADPAAFTEVKMDFKIAPGPFEPTWESIKNNDLAPSDSLRAAA